MAEERTSEGDGAGPEPTRAEPSTAGIVGLQPEDVVGGAVRGTVALMTRTAGLQVLGFVAFIGLARLITPAEFGLFVIALSVEGFAALFVRAGLPASMIRQPAPPSAEEQRALTGFSLIVAVVISGCALAVGFLVLPALGVDSSAQKVIAIALLSLPLMAARIVPFALLARELRFEPIAMIDVVARVALYAVALPTAALGFGALGLASAIPASALVASALASRVQPWARGVSFDLSAARSHLSFGLRVGVFRFFTAGFNLAFSSVAAAISGATLAGYYGLSLRVLGIPQTAAVALQRVGMSALSRVEEGAERARRMGQATALSGVALGAPLAVLVGSIQPLISVLFGDRWLPAADMIILSAPGLLVYAGMGSVIASRAIADGDARSPTIAAAARIGVGVALLAALTSPLGTEGAGIALSAGYLVYTALLFVRFHDAGRWRAAGAALRPVIVAAVAAGAGLAVRVGDGLVELAVAVGVSGVVWVALSLLLTRGELLSLIRVLRQHVGRGRPRSAERDAPLGPASVE